MYDYIIDLKDNKKYTINSNKGKIIFKKYLKTIYGGSNVDESFFDLIQKAQSDTNRMNSQRAELNPVLEKITEQDKINCNNKLGKLLGEGTSKKAYKTLCENKLWKPDSEFTEKFTKKNCKKSTILLSQEEDKRFFSEIMLQKKFKKPHIYKYGKCNDMSNYNYKIEELFDEDLFSWLLYNYTNRIFILDNTVILKNFKKKFFNLSNQLVELHDNNIAHLDIKPENIMIKYNNKLIDKLVLTDYGYARESPYNGNIGTPGYIDPEYLVDKNLTLKSDIFSLGITLFNCIFNSQTPFQYHSGTIIAYLINIKNYCPNPKESAKQWTARVLSPYHTKDMNLIDLLYNMLMCPRKNRFNIGQVIKHKWFK